MAEEKQIWRGEITVNGIPLQEYLGQHETMEKTKEMKEILSETIVEQEKIRLGAKQSEVAKQLRIVNGKPPYKPSRQFTDYEIRKEKGLMAKPYRSQTENILWVLSQQGPITTRDISKASEIDLRSVQSVLARIIRKAPSLIIKHKVGKTPATYRLCEPISTEVAYSVYKSKSVLAEKNENATNGEKHEAIPAVSSLPQKITVEVKGSIEVIFKFSK